MHVVELCNDEKTRVIGLPGSGRVLTICLAILTTHDTKGRTNRRKCYKDIALCIALHAYTIKTTKQKSPFQLTVHERCVKASNCHYSINYIRWSYTNTVTRSLMISLASQSRSSRSWARGRLEQNSP